ncbi:MAG: hypothetical protein QW641_00550 [Candidatus Aenigmatarchaeota archaeon]
MKKLIEAKKVIVKNARSLGFIAGDAYPQYWTRDFCYSLEGILYVGLEDIAKRHFYNILKRIEKDGSLPTLFYGKEYFQISYIMKSLSYSLTTIMKKERSMQLFHPKFFKQKHGWTTDSELLFLITAKEYFPEIYKKNEEKFELVYSNIIKKVDKNGLIKSSNWMDAMLNYNNKYSLLPNILLSVLLKNNEISKMFWNEKLGYYVDYIGSNRFDVLGNAIAILKNIPTKDKTEKICKNFIKLSKMFYACPNLYPPYPKNMCGQKPYTYQNCSIWPFVNGFVIKALLKAGYKKEALDEFEKISNLNGFNEWYELNGKPRGSSNQLWSAALYIAAYKNLFNSAI